MRRMIIPKAAVRKFLERPRFDFRPYKKLTPAQLQAKCDALPIGPPIWSRLNLDQKVLFVIGAKMRRFAFWADTGTGKTFLSIALARYFYRMGLIDRTLVLVPSKINKYEWAREVRKHSPKTTYIILQGSSEAKWKQIETSNSQLIIETYAGLVRMVSKLVTVKKKGKAPKDKLKLAEKLVRKLQDAVQGLVMDESIKVVMKKKHGSLMHRICRHVSKYAEMVFALNGTPHGRDPTDLWGQMRIVDGGETLGETLGLFRAAFFTETEDHWGGVKYAFIKKMAPVLNRIMANRSLRIEADESELPIVVPIIKKVSLVGDAETIYQEAKNDLIAAHGNFREMKNAFLRMRQISSGFVGYHDDELGIKAKYAFDQNPKLDSIMSVIDEVADSYKSVVFHDFIFSGDMIERELKDMGVGYVRLRGHKDDPLELLDRFDHDDKTRVFVLNNAEGSGLNLQIARYGLYYESPLPVIVRKQTRRRLERQRSKHNRIFLYDFIVQGTVDQRILDFHREGREIFEAVINGDPRALLGL